MNPVSEHLAALERALPDLGGADLLEVLRRLVAAQAAVAARLSRTDGEHQAGPGMTCLALAEAADFMRLGKSTIREKVAAGEFVEGQHFARHGRRLIFFRQALEDFMRSPRQRPVTEHDDDLGPIIPRRRRRHG